MSTGQLSDRVFAIAEALASRAQAVEDEPDVLTQLAQAHLYLRQAVMTLRVAERLEKMQPSAAWNEAIEAANYGGRK